MAEVCTAWILLMSGNSAGLRRNIATCEVTAHRCARMPAKYVLWDVVSRDGFYGYRKTLLFAGQRRVRGSSSWSVQKAAIPFSNFEMVRVDEYLVLSSSLHEE